VYPPNKCALCDANPKKGTVFTHHCPDAISISAYLGVQIQSSDILCPGCYKVYLSILTHLDKEPEIFNERLLEMIERWLEVKEWSTTTKLEKAVLETVIFVSIHVGIYFKKKLFY
jgi:hypothetical protein